MPTRRSLLLAALPFISAARAQSGLWPEWLGSYTGALRFHRSLPLHDIYPPPATLPVDRDDTAPFGLVFSIRVDDGAAAVWLRFDGGPMQTGDAGETMRFGTLSNGVATLTSFQAAATPRSATLTARPESLGTEALFSFADGSFWRRPFNARFTSTGADVIVWVFDANGTRARVWRGAAVKQPSRSADR